MAEIVKDTIVLDNSKVSMQTIYDEKIDFTSHKIILPEISDDELLARYEQISPVIMSEQLYWYLKRYELSQLRNQSYLWNRHEDKTEQFDMDSAETIAEFSCYHTYGYYGLFKPSIAEVLQQFPDFALQYANAFYMYESPEDMDDLRRQRDIVNAGCQKSKVRAMILKK